MAIKNGNKRNGNLNKKKYGALIMILLLKMASESNNDRSGVFSEGFLQKMFGFLQKTCESGTQATQGSNYIFFRR